jgi:hypothetical protein
MDAPRTLWTDRPIQTRNEDRLNFADYADILADIILTADTPITLGIFGPWGKREDQPDAADRRAADRSAHPRPPARPDRLV